MTPWATATGDKQNCRMDFIAATRDHIPSPRNFFILPSEDAHDATAIHNQWPSARIAGIEQDAKVFEHIEAKHLNVHIEHMTMRKYVDRMVLCPNGVEFDSAFLDYTGMLTRNRLHEVCKFVAFGTKPKSVVAITFQKSARSKYEQTRDLVAGMSWLEDDDTDNVVIEDGTGWNKADYVADTVAAAIEQGFDGVPGLRARLKRLDILQAREYQAHATSAAMYFIVLLIERRP